MSIYTYLRREHKLLRELIRKIEALRSDQTEMRDRLFNELKTKSMIHSKAEEKIFYSPLRKYPLTEEDVRRAKEEHADVDTMLERLSNHDLNGAAWLALFKSMVMALNHHIDEEENEIFEDAEKELSPDRAQEMEFAMRNEERAVKQRMHLNLR